MERIANGRIIRLVKGDITTARVDAIVNAANQHLAGGGGVDGAIHRAGGRQIMEECRAIGSCATGDAVVTGAGKLPARYVIHAVAPRWRGGSQGEMELLASAYRRSLESADAVEARTVAFPSLGTGIYGTPISPAAGVALSTTLRYLGGPTGIEEVVFYLFSADDLAVYEHVLARLTDEPGA